MKLEEALPYWKNGQAIRVPENNPCAAVDYLTFNQAILEITFSNEQLSSDDWQVKIHGKWTGEIK